MSEFKVGDWIIDPLIGDKVIKCHDGYLREMKFFGSVIRHATPEEAKAGWREGSKEFDLFWYGQSLGEAIRAHDLLGEELIEGGAAFIGNNSNIIQMVKDMGDDSHIENHISPNCKVEDV
ncbi:hypothetical protein [Acinetobacter calcoaceticus]